MISAPILALHLGTGGLRAYEHGIVEVGAYLLRPDSGEFEEFSAICEIEDDLSYSEVALRICGVSRSILEKEGEPISQILHRLGGFIAKHGDGHAPWAFGGQFVNDFLFQSCKRHGIDRRFMRPACALELYRCLGALGHHNSPWAQTQEVCLWAGVENGISPLGKARACALSVVKMLELLRTPASNPFSVRKER